MNMTIGQAAAKLGARDWQIRNLIKKGKLPEPPRLGPFRIYTEDDLPVLRRALEEAGYIMPDVHANEQGLKFAGYFPDSRYAIPPKPTP